MNRRRSAEAGVSGSPSPSFEAAPTVAAALRIGRRALEPHSGSEAQREAVFLLAGLLQISPGRLLLERGRALDEREFEEYGRRLERRAGGEPLQYIEGRAAFRHLSLRVDPSVLIPRPETEQLVGHVLEWSEGRAGLLGLDLGTGSGAIAISLLAEGPFDAVVGVDISSRALDLARENAAAAGVSGGLDLRLGPFFKPLRREERFHVVVSNPPYVASREADSLPEEVRRWEPPEALYAGPTGLEAIEQIVDEAPRHLEPGALLALEVAPNLAEAVIKRIELRGSYREHRVERDLAGHKRIVLAERSAPGAPSADGDQEP